MKSPKVWALDALVSYAASRQCLCGLPDGRWVAARPSGLHSLRSRLNAAYLVFTGKADAVMWTEQ